MRALRPPTNVSWGSIPRVGVITWVQFVVGSLLCSERLTAGILRFSLLLKPSVLNSNSMRNACTVCLMHESLAQEIGRPLLTLLSLNLFDMIIN